jgi:cobalt-zinc-cadmium efflux system outer membrane protein
MIKTPYFLRVFCCLLIINTQSLLAETLPHEDILLIDHTLTLHDLLEKSLPHYPNSQLLTAKKLELEARNIQAKSLLPSASSVVLRNQNDRLTSRNGESEWEAGVDIPIWLKGQRQAREAIASEMAKNLNTDATYLRLQLAGMIRDALWEVQLVQGLADIAKLKHAAALQLERDVDKRVKSGDLALKDFLVIQTETLQAETEKINAEAEVQHAKFRYMNLTGLHSMPAEFTESKSSKQDVEESHPVLQEAHGKIALSEQKRLLAHIETRDNPTFTLGTRSLRGAADTQHNTSLGLTLRIPLAADVRNAPLLANAEMQLAEQQMYLNQQLLLLKAAMHEAEHNLDVGEMQLEVLSKQNVIAQKSLETAQKGFQLGELDLIDLIRVQTQAFHANRLLKNQQIQQLWNTARFNQAVGELP